MHLTFYSSEKAADVGDTNYTFETAKDSVDGQDLAQRLKAAARALPDVVLDEEAPLLPLDHTADASYDFSPLVMLRRAHETDRAKKSLRKSFTEDVADNADGVSDPGLLSTRQKLAQQLYEVMKKHKDFDQHRLSTGLARAKRWFDKGSSSGGSLGDGHSVPASGNARNAALSADKASEQVRLLIFILLYHVNLFSSGCSASP
jgi:hypothetical protein